MTFQDKYKNQIRWLLQGDPAIRYQTLRDLVAANPEEINHERNEILKSGWGKRFIDLQQQNGTWSNALYSPKWTSTFYTLLLLKRFGSPASPATNKACNVLLDKGFYAKDGGIKYWKTWQQSECCVTAMLLAMLCHFNIEDDRMQRIAEFIVSRQMPDKGWNCEIHNGATHSSFHTTISVLESFWEYEKYFPGDNLSHLVRQKQNEGIEFLLDHHLYKSNTTWEIVDPKMTKLAFPPRWYYDIIRCLDYFQEKNIAKDKRITDAMSLLLKKQTSAGFWKLEIKYPAKIFFEMEKVGKESRWNTLRALRIIKWWEN